MSEPGGTGKLLPARMLNELAYCPRLFHLEWVQTEWADSEDTVSGRSVHRRVDRTSGSMPEPGGVEGGLNATSVPLDAPDLGMTARVDLLEAGDGTVIPVERKRGSKGARIVESLGPSIEPLDRGPLVV